jgi:dTDP-4-dehydrorhamnose reductase
MLDPAQTWLIIGAAGRLGYQLCRHLAASGVAVCGHVHEHGIEDLAIREVRADLADGDAVARLVGDNGARIIVHTAGLTDVDGCEAHPDDARRLHVDATVNLARAAQRAGARFIYISTDHLWDGTRAMVDEETPTAPMNVYARTKRDGEIAASAECRDALVLRTNIFGRGRPWRPSFSDWIERGLRERRTLTMFTDVYFTPIAMELLCPIIVEMTRRGACGLYHAAGGERLSKCDFARRLADSFGYDPAPIVPVSVAGVALTAPRPNDMSLSTHKIARFLGRPMPDCRESLNALRGKAEKPHVAAG